MSLLADQVSRPSLTFFIRARHVSLDAIARSLIQTPQHLVRRVQPLANSKLDSSIYLKQTLTGAALLLGLIFAVGLLLPKSARVTRHLIDMVIGLLLVSVILPRWYGIHSHDSGDPSSISFEAKNSLPTANKRYNFRLKIYSPE